MGEKPVHVMVRNRGGTWRRDEEMWDADAENTRGQWAVGAARHMVNMNASRNGSKQEKQHSP